MNWWTDDGLKACRALLQSDLSPAQAAAVQTVVADLTWQENEGREARAALEEAARLRPDSPTPLFQLALLTATYGDEEEVRAACERARRAGLTAEVVSRYHDRVPVGDSSDLNTHDEFPAVPRLHRGFLRPIGRLGEGFERIESREIAGAVYGLADKLEDTVEELVEEEQVTRLLRNAVRVRPENVEDRLRLARRLVSRWDVIRRRTAFNPQSVEVLDDGLLEEAALLYADAARLGDADGRARYGQGLALLRLGRAEEALIPLKMGAEQGSPLARQASDALENALGGRSVEAARTDSPAALEQVQRCASGVGITALGACQRALRLGLSPDHATRVRLLLVDHLRASSWPQGAIQRVLSAAVRASSEVAATRVAIAEYLIETPDVSLRTRAYDDVARAEPTSAAAWTLLGRAQESRRELPAAIEAYREAVRLSPVDQEPRLRLAQVLETAGKHEEARVEYETVTRMSGADAEVFVGLARTCLAAGRLREAAEAIVAACARVKAALPNDEPLDSDHVRFRRRVAVSFALGDSSMTEIPNLIYKLGRGEAALHAYHAYVALGTGWTDHWFAKQAGEQQ